jgi:hypothetical protein
MTFDARCRINPAIDLVLIEIIPWMRQRPLGRILILVAWLQFIPMCMAVGTKGLLVADHTCPALLLCKKTVPLCVIARMIQRRPPVLVAVAAEGSCCQFDRVLHSNARHMGTGIHAEEHHENNHGN